MQMILSYKWSFDFICKSRCSCDLRWAGPQYLKALSLTRLGFVFIFLIKTAHQTVHIPTCTWNQSAQYRFGFCPLQSEDRIWQSCFACRHQVHLLSSSELVISLGTSALTYIMRHINILTNFHRALLCTSFISNTIILKIHCKISALVLHTQSEVLHGDLNMFISILHLFLLLLLTTPCLIWFLIYASSYLSFLNHVSCIDLSDCMHPCSLDIDCSQVVSYQISASPRTPRTTEFVCWLILGAQLR